MNNQKGFTLVEFIVVVAIMGILAVVGVTNYTGYKHRAMINQDASSAMELIRAARITFNETGTDPLGGSEKEVEDIQGILKTDVHEMMAVSCDGTANNNFKLSYDVDNDIFTVKWTADSKKAGPYAREYTVEEGIDFAGPVKSTN